MSFPYTQINLEYQIKNEFTKLQEEMKDITIGVPIKVTQTFVLSQLLKHKEETIEAYKKYIKDIKEKGYIVLNID